MLKEIRSKEIDEEMKKNLLEELYCRKNNWQKKKCITEPKLIAIRRRKIQAVRMEAEYAGASSKGNLMRKVHCLKEVIQLLKTIQGTEEERKTLLQEMAQMEEASLSEMMVWSNKQDASHFLEVIAPRYKGVYMVNAEKDTCRYIYVPFYFQEMLEKNHGSFWLSMKDYYHTFVRREYYERFEKILDYKYL